MRIAAAMTKIALNARWVAGKKDMGGEAFWALESEAAEEQATAELAMVVGGAAQRSAVDDLSGRSNDRGGSGATMMDFDKLAELATTAWGVVKRAVQFVLTPRAYVRRYSHELGRPYRAIAVAFAGIVGLNVVVKLFFTSLYGVSYEPKLDVLETIGFSVVAFILGLVGSYGLVFMATHRVRSLERHAWEISQQLNANLVFGSVINLTPFFTLFPFIPDVRAQKLAQCGPLLRHLEPNTCKASEQTMIALLERPLVAAGMNVMLVVVLVAVLALFVLNLISRTRFMSEYYGIPVGRLVLCLLLWPILLPWAVVKVAAVGAPQAPANPVQP